MTYRYLRRVAVVHQGMHWFIIGLLIPILALAQLEKGLSLVQLGFTGTVMSLTGVLLEVPTGGIADTIGRKRTYLLSNAVQAGGLLLLAVAGGLPSVTVGLGLFGVARALSSGSIEALFIDEFQRLSPEGNLQPFLARIELAALAGLALGGLVGGYLPDTVGTYLARYRLFDRFAATLLIAALTAALQALLTTVFVHEQTPDRGATGDSSGSARLVTVLATSLRIVRGNRLILALMIAAGVWGVSFAGLETFWQPHVVSLGQGPGQTAVFGMITMGYFLAGAVGSAAAASLSRLFRGRLSVVVATLRIVSGGLFVVLALGHSLGAFTAVYLILFSMNGLASSPEETLFNQAVPGSVRSTLLSFRSLFLQTGGAIGSLVLGFVAEHRSIRLAWQIGGVAFALSALLFVSTARSERAAPSPTVAGDRPER